MRRTTEEMIVDYINRGYEKVLATVGDKESVEEKRVELKSRGFDARWWTFKHPGELDSYVLYAKKMERKPRKVASPVGVVSKNSNLSVKMIDVQIQANFDKMTVKELKSYCQKKSISGYSKMNKAQMIAALTA